MNVNMKIDIRHLTRVEGHGNIHIAFENGKLVDAKWAIVETPRFFEAMLRGISVEMAPILTARICGICSIGHTLASLRAIENALDIDIPFVARKIRLLAKHGETLQSHFLHLFFLVSPDFFDQMSVIPLVQSNRLLVDMALRLKRLANNMCDVLAGRTTHPVNLCIGGIGRVPDKLKLRELRENLAAGMDDVEKTVELFKTIEMPEFIRETEFVALKGENEYPWIGGSMMSTDGVLKTENEYLAMTNEYTDEGSTSKLTRLSRNSFAVGALARINNNYNFLKAKDVAGELGLRPVLHNPFMNNVAQLVECVHVLRESMEILDVLLDGNLDKIREPYEAKACEGVGAVEAPRGILYHHYCIDEMGRVEKANCIIPTTQNNANIHYDLVELAEKAVRDGKGEAEVKKLCEMLVRAYDPCISCSVH